MPKKKPEIGDTVRILPMHQGYTRGQIGTVINHTHSGRLRVRITSNQYAQVLPENLEVIRQ